jgi:hypothetical protein
MQGIENSLGLQLCLVRRQPIRHAKGYRRRLRW